MNLQGIVRQAIQSVNPDVVVSFMKSTGYTIATNGKQAPSYAPAVPVPVQVQPITTGDIVRLNALNIQGVFKRIYAQGAVRGIVRADGTGGDIFQFAEYAGGPVRNWKTTQVSEVWPDWSSVVVTLQVS